MNHLQKQIYKEGRQLNNGKKKSTETTLTWIQLSKQQQIKKRFITSTACTWKTGKTQLGHITIKCPYHKFGHYKSYSQMAHTCFVTSDDTMRRLLAEPQRCWENKQRPLVPSYKYQGGFRFWRFCLSYMSKMHRRV